MSFSSLFTALWAVYFSSAILIAAAAEPLGQPIKKAPAATHSGVSKAQSPTATPQASLTPSLASIPTVVLQLGDDQAVIPDWTKLSFANLPALAQSGSLGDISWRAGDPVDRILSLSDFQDSFQLQNLNLYAIALATQREPKTVPLSQFKLLQRQTLAVLVNAVPDLGRFPISSVKPIADLLKNAKPDYQFDELTPLSVVAQDPMLGTLDFSHFDLAAYRLTDIPGLIQTPFTAFEDWQQAGINDIPGLRAVPWRHFIGTPDNDALIGIVQLSMPGDSMTPISGSQADDYQADCPGVKVCPSISFSQNSLLNGKVWISGSVQMVKGGRGELAAFNSGLEPTGRNLYGDGFKVVVGNISESEIKTDLYFHRCQRQSTLTPTSCSPYAIGPVPFQKFKQGDPMLVGVINPRSSAQETALSLPASENLPAPAPETLPFWQQWAIAIAEAFAVIFRIQS